MRKEYYLIFAMLLALGFSPALKGMMGLKPPYDVGKLKLLTSYVAKEYCSCTYVLEMNEQFCQKFVKMSSVMPRISRDKDLNVVSASFLGAWKSKAHFLDKKKGCILK